jgi:hypothetical protein
MTELTLFPKNPTADTYEYELDDGFEISYDYIKNMMYVKYNNKTKYIFDLSMFEVIEFSDPVDIL